MTKGDITRNVDTRECTRVNPISSKSGLFTGVLPNHRKSSLFDFQGGQVCDD